MSKQNSTCNAKLSEYLNGLSVIRAFGLESWAKDNYDQVVDKHLGSTLKANTFYSFTRPLTNFMCGFPLIGLFLFGGQGVLAGTVSLGVFVAFVRYCERFSFPLAALTREIHVIQQAFTSAERVTSFLQAYDENHVLGVDGKIERDHLLGDLVFQNVTMSYDQKNPVLKDVNFHISPGERIGLAGTTGSGKTTTVSLLARLYDFQEGKIFVDGNDIRDYNRNDLRSKLGFVSQDVIIFKGSLRENLTCEAEISDEKIRKGAEQTGLLQILHNNNMTLDSQILEGGSNLSVGERQLISLTRVLLRDPSILVLDEATANIDPYFEKIIHNTVDLLMKNRTCLIIAHRLETLKTCDRLFVFERGRLIENGPHDRLIAEKGHFYNLQQASLKQKDLHLSL